MQRDTALQCMQRDTALQCMQGDTALQCMQGDTALQCMQGDTALQYYTAVLYAKGTLYARVHCSVYARGTTLQCVCKGALQYTALYMQGNTALPVYMQGDTAQQCICKGTLHCNVYARDTALQCICKGDKGTLHYSVQSVLHCSVYAKGHYMQRGHCTAVYMQEGIVVHCTAVYMQGGTICKGALYANLQCICKGTLYARGHCVIYTAVQYTLQYSIHCSTVYTAVYTAVQYTLQYTLQCKGTLYAREHYAVVYMHQLDTCKSVNINRLAYVASTHSMSPVTHTHMLQCSSTVFPCIYTAIQCTAVPPCM